MNDTQNSLKQVLARVSEGFCPITWHNKKLREDGFCEACRAFWTPRREGEEAFDVPLRASVRISIGKTTVIQDHHVFSSFELVNAWNLDDLFTYEVMQLRKGAELSASRVLT